MPLDSSVLSLLPAASGSLPTVLSALYSKSTSGAVNPVTALRQAETGEAKGVAGVAGQTATKRDVAAFRNAVATAKTPADLLANPEALKVLLTANGLGDQAQYGALASKALLSDTSKTGSLASKLSDQRWLTIAKTYDFANQGLALLRKSGVVDTIANGYAEVKWRESLDTTTPGLSNALDFRSRASSITTADQILGDSTLRSVVLTTLSIPQQIAFQPLEAQEKAITDRLDITKFKDPAFVEQFSRRYLIAQANASATSSTTSTTGVASLFA